MASGVEKAQQNKMIRDLLQKAMVQTIPNMTNADFVKLFGDTVPKNKRTNITYAELMIHKLVANGCTGSMAAIKEIMDRLLGKATQETVNINQNHSYVHFLEELPDDEDELPVIEAQAVPVEPTVEDELAAFGL